MTPEKKENLAIAALLVVVLLAVVVVTYSYRSAHPSNPQQERLIANLQLRSTSAEVMGMNSTGLSVNFKAVVYNPNDFGAKLVAADYSVYANGYYLGSGQTTHEYDVTPLSSQAFTFPVTVSWASALKTTGNYILALGQVTWEVKGIATVEVGGIPLSGSFEFTAA